MVLCYANKPVASGIVAPVSVRDAFGNKIGIVNVGYNKSPFLLNNHKHLCINRNRLESNHKVQRVGCHLVRLVKSNHGSRLCFVRLLLVVIGIERHVFRETNLMPFSVKVERKRYFSTVVVHRHIGDFHIIACIRIAVLHIVPDNLFFVLRPYCQSSKGKH